LLTLQSISVALKCVAKSNSRLSIHCFAANSVQHQIGTRWATQAEGLSAAVLEAWTICQSATTRALLWHRSPASGKLISRPSSRCRFCGLGGGGIYGLQSHPRRGCACQCVDRLRPPPALARAARRWGPAKWVGTGPVPSAPSPAGSTWHGAVSKARRKGPCLGAVRGCLRVPMTPL
jgi:hypothetical protein